MATLRKFFWLELETGALCIGILGIFGSLMKFHFLNDRYYEPISMQALVYIVACALLIFGTMKRVHYYLLPWLILSFIGIILTTFVVVSTIILLCFHNDQMHRAVQQTTRVYISEQRFESFVVFFTVLIAIYALLIYMFMAISSLYVMFKNEHQRIVGFLPSLGKRQVIWASKVTFKKKIISFHQTKN